MTTIPEPYQAKLTIAYLNNVDVCPIDGALFCVLVSKRQYQN